MYKKSIIILPIALLAASQAHAMNAQVFYSKGLALKEMGNAAILSSDYSMLKNAAQKAANAVKRENDLAKKRGKPIFCPPANPNSSADGLLRDLGALGKSSRQNMTVQQAFRSIAIKRYPCRA